MSLKEQLLKEAEEQSRIGDSYKDCSWMGEPPWDYHYKMASLLRQAAIQIKEGEVE